MNKVNTFRVALLFVLLLVYVNAQSQINTFYCEGGLHAGDTNKIQLRYVIDGRKWDCRFLTYYFVNGTADVSGTAEYNAVLNAMESWAEVTNIYFIEACNATYT